MGELSVEDDWPKSRCMLSFKKLFELVEAFWPSFGDVISSTQSLLLSRVSLGEEARQLLTVVARLSPCGKSLHPARVFASVQFSSCVLFQCRMTCLPNFPVVQIHQADISSQ